MRRKTIYLNKGDWYDLTGDGRFSARILRKDKKMYTKRRRTFEKFATEREIKTHDE